MKYKANLNRDQTNPRMLRENALYNSLPTGNVSDIKCSVICHIIRLDTFVDQRTNKSAEKILRDSPRT